MRKKFGVRKIRRIVGIIWCAIFVLFLGYVISCAQNEKLIEQVDEGYVRTSDIPYFGFLHGYKAPYNKGNVYYLKANYEKACECYKKALKYQIPEYEDCKVRVNYALALVAPLDRDSIDKSNVDEAIDTLLYARSILLANGCASDEDGVSGHDFNAQKLKEEIDAYIEELRELQTNQNNQNDNSNSGNQSDQNNNDQSNNDQKNNDQKNNDQNENNSDNQQNQDNQENQDNKDSQDNQENQDNKDSQDNKENQDNKEKSPEEQKKEELRKKYQELDDAGNQERNEEMNDNRVSKDGYYSDIYW